jgi:hypothetical protein
MDSQALKIAFGKLRRETKRFINVSNSEWYTLFKDEIRNSIAIEGIFANRKELLDVLERNKRTSNEKVAAILGYYESVGNSQAAAGDADRSIRIYQRLPGRMDAGIAQENRC